MELYVTFPENSTSLPLSIIKELSGGQVPIYHVSLPDKRSTYVLKLFPKTQVGTYSYLKENLISELSHPNVVQNVRVNYNSKEFHAILTEYVNYGDFLDLLMNDIFNDESIVRTYFHQLIEGLEYIHLQGIAHLDIKLENLALSSNLTLKIIDFDRAQLIRSPKLTSNGTKLYRAPEVLNKSCNDFKAADVFSAGVLLYSLRMKEFPFSEVNDPACKNKKSYQSFANNNGTFWEEKKSSKKGHLLNSDFIELINGMLHADVNQRFSIQDIKQSKWYSRETLDYENLMQTMRPRLQELIERRNE